MAKCNCCGQTIKAKPRAKARAISFGKGPSRWIDQGAEYALAMQVKRGELVWSPHANGNRFGARGGYVTPSVADEYLLVMSA